MGELAPCVVWSDLSPFPFPHQGFSSVPWRRLEQLDTTMPLSPGAFLGSAPAELPPSLPGHMGLRHLKV